MLNKKSRQAIIDHALAEYPRESCGVIVGNEYIACENISQNIAQFEIKPSDLMRASTKGKIQAYVHSHPDGNTQPTMIDRVQMGLPIALAEKLSNKNLLNHSLPWVITNGVDIAIHKPESYEAPLIGRDYYHGLMDCYTLVRDYYQRELGITLSDYERDDVWWESASNNALYLDNFKNEGFIAIDTDIHPIKEHDVLLCRLGRTEHVNHALVFIGDGALKSERTDDVIGDCLVLHHPYNKTSVREIYGEIWQRRVAVVIRHKDLL